MSLVGKGVKDNATLNVGKIQAAHDTQKKYKKEKNVPLQHYTQMQYSITGKTGDGRASVG